MEVFFPCNRSPPYSVILKCYSNPVSGEALDELVGDRAVDRRARLRIARAELVEHRREERAPPDFLALQPTGEHVRGDEPAAQCHHSRIADQDVVAKSAAI